MPLNHFAPVYICHVWKSKLRGNNLPGLRIRWEKKETNAENKRVDLWASKTRSTRGCKLVTVMNETWLKPVHLGNAAEGTATHAQALMRIIAIT